MVFGWLVRQSQTNRFFILASLFIKTEILIYLASLLFDMFLLFFSYVASSSSRSFCSSFDLLLFVYIVSGFLLPILQSLIFSLFRFPISLFLGLFFFPSSPISFFRRSFQTFSFSDFYRRSDSRFMLNFDTQQNQNR